MWPIDCELERTCFIQNYVDRDPGPGARDFACGTLTYDGHKGTDIALPDLIALRRGVRVLAAAPGRVRAVRDDVVDRSFTEPGQDAVVRQRECGNGVVIVHEDGWESQYCHLRNGSVAVRPGQSVAAGDALGRVGLSGRTEFPHLHFELRRNGRAVDPFDDSPDSAKCGQSAHALWRTGVAYRATGLIAMGFAPTTPDRTAAEHGEYIAHELASSAPALSVWVQIYGARKGDRLALRIFAADGSNIVDAPGMPLPRNQSRYFQFAGLRRGAKPWPEGTYRGEFQLTRGDEVVLRIERTASIR
jgi:hypothetical protein